jgi:hypothetical protein
MERLGTNFHETFALDRPRLAVVLRVAHDCQRLDSGTLKANSTLGNNQIKAMLRYAVGTGLVEPNSKRLTPLGKTVLANDPTLSQPATQWLLHYHLSAPCGPGPLLWHHLAVKHLRQGHSITRDYLYEEATRIAELELRKEVIERFITVFIGTYARQGRLDALQLLRQENAQRYQVCAPLVLPNDGVVGYALAHYWRTVCGESNLVPIAEFTRQDSLASLLLLRPAQFEETLERLQHHGLLEIWRQAQPYQIAKRWSSPDAFLTLVYRQT